jgi:hypothetical protein
MYPDTQVFFDFTLAFRTLLGSASGINNSKEFAPFPTYILGDGAELTKSSIKHLLTQHPFGANSVVQIFHENHIPNITKGMGLFEMKVFSDVVNVVVKSGNLDPLLLIVT